MIYFVFRKITFLTLPKTQFHFLLIAITVTAEAVLLFLEIVFAAPIAAIPATPIIVARATIVVFTVVTNLAIQLSLLNPHFILH